MKIVYIGISSKFIHTMPAGWFLSEYLKHRGIAVTEIYSNINMPYQGILSQVLAEKPDKLLVSVYIFNATLLKKLIKDIKKFLPLCEIIVGGPEADEWVGAHKVIKGEGEQALYEYLTKGKIDTLCPLEDLDAIPSPYTKDRVLSSQNKLIYYESSRGCPFHCSYCMASNSKKVRYFSLDRVKEDLTNLVSWGVKIIKFTDRTFNANTQRTDAILTFIKEKFSNSETCFHFEVGGDLFKQSSLEILKELPKGLVQIEAGVQSLNLKTLKAVNRKFDKEKFINNISQIIGFGNIHTHLDLIAGLPYEDKESFISSFNQTIALRPHMLQLGFLKFLKGTPIRQTYNAEYSKTPPYEIISSTWLSKEDIAELKKVEYVLDKLYNTNRFHFTLRHLFEKYKTPYQALKNIAYFFDEKGLKRGMSLNTIYQTMLEFMNYQKAKDLLRLDFVISNNSRKIPRPIKEPYDADFKLFLQRHPQDRYVLYQRFSYLPDKPKGNYVVKVDYSKRDKVSSLYEWQIIKG